jgi:hypothetical protein
MAWEKNIVKMFPTRFTSSIQSLSKCQLCSSQNKTKKAILIFVWNQNQDRGIIVPDFKVYYKAAKIKTTWW